MGKTILISSHILPELADLCNKVGIIEIEGM
jgi:ABC-2 type transport system ATP-binding protein